MTFIPLNIYLKILTSKVCEVVALVTLFCVSFIINEIKFFGMFFECFELPFLLVSFLKAVYILCLHSCWLPSFSWICTSSLYIVPADPLS